MTTRAIRGATTVAEDTVEEVEGAVEELMAALMDRNSLDHEDVISIIFTATPDVVSTFPATAARGFGYGAIPLLCAAEIPVPNATPRCIRVMMHVETDRPKSALRHVYLRGARGLNDDLPG